MAGTETVLLRGGLTVGLRALQLLWDLEERGFQVRRDNAGYLVVSPKTQISTEDDEAIRSCRDELLRLVEYCDVAM